MKTIITEEMKYRHKVVLYAIKHNNNTKAARRYNTSRQQVQRWRRKYTGTIKSLVNQSRRPHHHPNQHTSQELELLEYKYKKHGYEGMGQVYRKCRDAGYSRSYGSMCKQIRKLANYEKKKQISYPKSKYKPLKGHYPGEYVEIDVKYVPDECIGFRSNYARYYQITAIDLYSRKRVLKLVNEHSNYETTKMLLTLEEQFGFKIKTIQTDNGSEFCNDKSERLSSFEETMKRLEIEHKRTRPYSLWQNGVVERSHKIDNKLFYNKRRFKSEKELYQSFKRYSSRTNNIARKVLNFKTPNEMVQTYFSRNA